MTGTSHDETASRNTEVVERLHQQFQSLLAALVTSEDWQQALTVAARFHTYSFSNTQLIWAQAAARGFTPTRVTGYRTWRSLGRQVRRGERGLGILAPIIRNVSAETEDPSEQEERRVVGFRPVHVFDISQTDGEPLPDTSPALLEGELPACWQTIARLITDAGYSLEPEADKERLGSANGLTDMAQRHVAIREGLSGSQRFKTGVHELAHVSLHEPGSDGRPDCRGTVEVEAESVAYMVCAFLGLDSAEYSLPYVASWSGGDLDQVAATANRVIGCAHQVIEQLEIDRELDRVEIEQRPPENLGVATRQVWEVAVEPESLSERTTELGEVLTAAVSFYQEYLTRPTAERARAYLTGRGFTADSVEEWQLGYAPPSWNGLTQQLRSQGFDDALILGAGVAGQAESGRLYDLMRGRIVFPVLDEQGVPRGLAGRQIVGDGPKYLNGPDTALYAKRELLYGLHQANEPIRARHEAIVVEGYTDVIAAHQAGFENVVGTSGTALTEHHLDTLANAAGSVILAFDGDSAGANAIETNSRKLLDADAEIRVAALPPGQDPASILASGGGSRFAELIVNAPPVALYLVDRVLEGINLDEVEGPVRAVVKSARLLGVRDPSNQSPVVEHLASRINRDNEFVATAFQRYALSTRSDRDLGRGIA